MSRSVNFSDSKPATAGKGARKATLLSKRVLGGMNQRPQRCESRASPACYSKSAEVRLRTISLKNLAAGAPLVSSRFQANDK